MKDRKFSLLNKSVITNIAAALIIAAGYLSPWYKDQLKNVGFFALSGALTNWLAVIMLFEKIPLLYGSGVIPKHFEDIKLGIKNLIMNEFFTQEKTREVFKDLKVLMLKELDLTSAVEKIDYDSIFDSLKKTVFHSKWGGMFSMFGGQNMLEKYREPFIEQIKAYIYGKLNDPDFIDSLLSGEGDQNQFLDHVTVKIEEIIFNRLEELTPEMTKKIVQDMIKKHLGWLVVWGGLFGGILGLIMSLIP